MDDKILDMAMLLTGANSKDYKIHNKSKASKQKIILKQDGKNFVLEEGVSGTKFTEELKKQHKTENI